MTLVLAGIAIFAAESTARAAVVHDIVVMHCDADGTYMADEDASTPRLPGWGRDCAEQLSRLLGAGYALVHAGGADKSAPVVYTLIRSNDAAARTASHISPESSAVALLRCEKEDRLGRLVLAGFDATGGITGLRHQYGTSCAAAIGIAMDAGLSIANVVTGQNDSDYLLYTLTNNTTRLRFGSRGRDRAFDASLVRCGYDYERNGQGSFNVTAGGSTAVVPYFDTESCGRCAKALAALFDSGFSLYDVQPGENADVPTFTFFRARSGRHLTTRRR